MRQRLVPSILGALCLTASAYGVTADERDSHFATLRELIADEFHLVAERQLAAYREAEYPDRGGLHLTTLEWLFYDTFALSVGGDRAAEYSAEAKERAARLEEQREQLPARLAAIYQPAGKIQRIARKLNRDYIRPDSPPPLSAVGYTPDDIAVIEGLVKLLVATADSQLQQRMQAVEDYQETYESAGTMDRGKEYWAIIRQATMLRFQHADTFYQAYKPLREIVIRRDALVETGIPASLIDEVVDPWLRKTAQRLGEDYSEWDWTFGQYYVFLKHRLAVLQAEYVRHNRGKDDPLINYDLVQTAFLDCLQTDTGDFDRQTREQIERLKYEIWSDLFYWHLAIGDDDALAKAAELWDTFQEMTADDRRFSLDSRDEFRQVMAGHLHMLAARLRLAQGDATGANSLMAEVQKSGNFFQGNAKQWIAYFASGDVGGADPWFAQPRPMDPDKALPLGRALLAQGSQVLDAEQSANFYEQAAAALRDGLLGLPLDQRDQDFVAHAPALYQALAFALYKRGWYFRAVAVAQQGLERFSPDLWGEQPDQANPWVDHKGAITTAGNLVRRLANDGMAYANSLYARTRSDAANSMLTAAIDQLRAFDPSKVEENSVRMEIILLIQSGDYQRAHDKATEYYRQSLRRSENERGKSALEQQIEALWGLRMATRAMFELWQELREETVPRQAEIERTSDRLGRLAGVLTQFAAQADKIPEKYRGEFLQAQKEVLNFRIAKMFVEERYREIAAELDPDFWVEAPGDERLIRGFLGYLAGSVYRMNQADAKRIQAAVTAVSEAADQRAALVAVVNDAAGSILGNWAFYVGAHASFDRVVRDYLPSIDTLSPGIRKQLAQVFNVNSRLLEQLVLANLEAVGEARAGMLRAWITGTTEADGPEADGPDPGQVLQAIDADVFAAADENGDGTLSDEELASGRSARVVVEALSRASKRRFADLYEPIIDANEKESTLLAVANTLWELDEKPRAAKLYEIYRERIENDADLQTFLADPLAVVAEIKPLVTGRAELNAAWDRDRRGSIPDLLVDEPGFIEQFYTNANADPEDWPEDKADPFAAERAIAAFSRRYDELENLLPNYQEGREALDRIADLVERWAYAIVIDTRLIEAYREMGELSKAVRLARRLYRFDPRDPVFMSVVVDGTLEAAKSGQVDDDDITEARKVAAELRNDSKVRSDWFNYWLASIQVLELSRFIPDIAVINRILRNNNARKIYPPDDLFTRVGEDFALAEIPDGYGVLKRDEPVKVGDEMVDRERMVGTLDRSAMQLIRRYLALHQIDGVTVAPRIRISEEDVVGPNGADKTIYLIEYGPTGGEG